MNNIGTSTFHFPTHIRFGVGVIKELPLHLKSQQLSRPLIVTDPGLARLPMTTGIIRELESAGLSPVVFSDIHKNPVKSDVTGGVKAYHTTNADAVVGLGGGASLDVARAIVLKVHHPLDLFDYEDSRDGWQLVTAQLPYFITVPTTSGTGSEVGRSTVISDDVTHAKKIIFSPRLMARAVFADPELTLELPSFITAATGMDALTHNIEAYLASGFQPLCDGIALEGIRLIAKQLERAVNRPDIEARTLMMASALMGAVAFQKGLGVVHSTAHALSTCFDMHHGLANAIMLSYGMEFNAPSCPERLATIAEVLGLKEKTPIAVVNWLRELNGKIGLPVKLSAQGVTSADVDGLATLALKDACHALNPRPVTHADFLAIYRQAL